MIQHLHRRSPDRPVHVPQHWHRESTELQREGWTLTEIALHLEVPRPLVAQYLYDRVVRK